MKTFDELWKELEENFDWERVHKVMIFLEWDWKGEGVPSVDKLKTNARKYCNDCWEIVTLSDRKNSSSIRTGGFFAEYRVFHDGPNTHNDLTLEFVLESFSVW